jgi:hypothetical protein
MPHVTVEDIDAAQQYYHEHQAEIDREIAEGEQLEHTLRQAMPSFCTRNALHVMPDRIRFHLDEHVDPAIAAGLQRYGIDVTTTVAAALRTKDDEVHLAFANAEHRVIVTHDNDYLRFHAQGMPHPGMAYCPPQTRSMGHIIAMLRLMWEIMTPEEMRNRVEFL